MLSLKNCFPKVTSVVTFPPDCEKKNMPSMRKKKNAPSKKEEEKEGNDNSVWFRVASCKALSLSSCLVLNTTVGPGEP